MESPPQEGTEALRYDHQREGTEALRYDHQREGTEAHHYDHQREDRYVLGYDRGGRFHLAMALASSMVTRNDSLS